MGSPRDGARARAQAEPRAGAPAPVRRWGTVRVDPGPPHPDSRFLRVGRRLGGVSTAVGCR